MCVRSASSGMTIKALQKFIRDLSPHAANRIDLRGDDVGDPLNIAGARGSAHTARTLPRVRRTRGLCTRTTFANDAFVHVV